MRTKSFLFLLIIQSFVLGVSCNSFEELAPAPSLASTHLRYSRNIGHRATPPLTRHLSEPQQADLDTEFLLRPWVERTKEETENGQAELFGGV